jgi:hypothetical protein
MLSLLQQSSEALAGTLGQAHSATVPASDQVGHRFGGRRNARLKGALVQAFERLAHEVGPGAAGLAYEALKEGGGFRVDPDIQSAHG